MRVLFLDFDGVLNGAYNAWQGLDPAKVALVNQIIDRTGARVVVSSSWRKGASLRSLRALLAASGFTGRVVGKTPDWGAGLYRGREILGWLESPLGRQVTGLAILDDDRDMLSLSDYLVRTDPQVGMRPVDAQLAIVVLGRAYVPGAELAPLAEAGS